MKGFVYLASPYSHIDPAVRVERYREAVRFLRWHLAKRDWAYSPIAHTHDAQLGDRLKLTDDEWQTYSKEMLSQASCLHVLTLDGWRKSPGIAQEIISATDWGMAIAFFFRSDEDYVAWEPNDVEQVAESLKSA